MKYLLILIVCFNFSFSQSSNDGKLLCIALNQDKFSNKNEADESLEKILSVIGLAKNFAVVDCDNISNALAITYRGNRFILYDPNFITKVSGGNDWKKLFILAHEVGHHVNGHSREIDSNFRTEFSFEESRKEELEADEFAAFVLSKLKAPLNDLIELMSEEDLSVSDEEFSTHPSQESRILAIKSGYKKAGYAIENMISRSVTANDYLNKGIEYYSFGDMVEAENNFKKAIYIDETTSLAHYYLGRIFEKRSPTIAINYYKKTIKFDQNFYPAHEKIGYLEFINNNFEKAIPSLKKVINNRQNVMSHLLLGLSYEKIDSLDQAYNQLSVASNLGDIRILEDLSRVEKKRGNLKNALEIVSSLIDNHKEPNYYNLRGNIHVDMGNLRLACIDFKIASLLDNNFELVDKFCD